jgi:hypothetical protein
LGDESAVVGVGVDVLEGEEDLVVGLDVGSEGEVGGDGYNDRGGRTKGTKERAVS